MNNSFGGISGGIATMNNSFGGIATMNNTHAPGPWKAVHGRHGWVVEAADGQPIAVVYGAATASKDAAVLAASAELLVELKKLVSAIERMSANPADGLADEARRVIAKAEG